MNRTELEDYIRTQYGVHADHPWPEDPESAVFRHGGNRKWFALVMNVKRSSVGLPGEDRIDAVNLKCPPLMIGSLLSCKGFMPAYHMNKQHWITALLGEPEKGEAADDESLKAVLEMSFEMTAPKRKRHDENQD